MNPWNVASTNVAASQLGKYLESLAGQGLEAQVHLAGPMGRNPHGQVVYEATYLVLARAVEGPARGGEAPPPAAAAPAPEPEPEAPPDWLVALEPGLRDALAAVGITTIAGLAAGWPDQITAIDGLTLQDGQAMQALLASYAAGDAPPEPKATPAPPKPPNVAQRAPMPPPPPPPPMVPPPNGGGLVLLPGMEGKKVVPRGYTRPRSELSPELRDAAVLDGKPNVFHQPSVVLPRRALNADKDGVEFKEG